MKTTILPCQAIIFDLDGTLIDSAPSILQCFASALSDAGLQPAVPLNASLIGPPLRKTLMHLTGVNDDAILDRLTNSFKEFYDTEGYKASRVYPGIDALLAELSALPIPLAIATNKRRIPTLKIMDHLNWNRYFSLIGTLDTPSPPHPDKAALIRSQLNEMHASAENSWYVGDKWEDGEAAQNNGMPFIAVDWGYGDWDGNNLPESWLNAKTALELAPLLTSGFKSVQTA